MVLCAPLTVKQTETAQIHRMRMVLWRRRVQALREAPLRVGWAVADFGPCEHIFLTLFSSQRYTHYRESSIYVVSGSGRFLSGPGLEKSDAIARGDFIYVPPNSVHQPINDSESETMELIVARNTPVEIVVEYDPRSPEMDVPAAVTGASSSDG